MSARSPPFELNDTISKVLRYGTVLSATVLAAGLALMVLEAPAGSPQNLQAMLSSGFGTPTLSPSALIAGIAAGNPVSVLELGALILVATPLVRVSASVCLFLGEKDELYAGITAIVLVMLLVAIFVIGPIEA